MNELQARNRAVWSAGDWDGFADVIAAAGPRLLDLIDLRPGMELLDVGTGSGGNVAIPAALRGARVTGSDLTDAWFAGGRRRAQAAGVEVEWVEADVEEMPFADAVFDRVVSTFGHMFAPHHAIAAAEMARVCRPDGMIATTTWTPEGYVGALFRTVGGHMPPPPPEAQPPGLWGSTDHAESLWEPLGFHCEFRRDHIVFDFDSAEALFGENEDKFGPIVTAKAVLGDGFATLREDTIAMMREWSSDPGRCRIEAEYLITLARRD